MTIDGIELRRLEHPESAKDPARFTPLWEGVIGSDVPASSDHLTLIIQALASDGEATPTAGTVRLSNRTIGAHADVGLFGLSTSLTISTAALAPLAGHLIAVSARPEPVGSVWIDRATLTVSPGELVASSPSDYGPPAAVVLTATGLDGGFTLTFTPPLGVLVGPALMQYGFRQQGAETFTYSATGDVDGSFTVSAGLTNDVAHEAVVRFRADSDGEWGAWSNEAPFTPTAGGAPTPPGQMTNFGVTG